MSAPTPPELPSFTNKTTFFALAQGLFVWLTTTFMQWVDATATAMNFYSTNDVSTSSVLIGTGSKSLTVSASKSYVGGMYVVISDNTTPGTTNSVNSMTGQITSYNSSTGALVVNVLRVLGSGTKTAWVISQCAPPSLEVSTTMQAVTSQTTLAAGRAALGVKQLESIDYTLSGNALTLKLNPTNLDFRSTTLTSGLPSNVANASQITTTISSGSTGGTTSGVQSDVILLAINNAGTMELAWTNLAGGLNLDETNLINTVAEGGAGAADSVNVIYSTTARTGVAYRVVGLFRSTQTTAGAWAQSPALVQGSGYAALGALVKRNFTDLAMPGFSAKPSGTQTLTSSTFTKVQCDTEEYDLTNSYDNSSLYRFTPLVAGIYLVNFTIGTNTSAGLTRSMVTLYKNGAEIKRGQDTGANTVGSSGSALVLMNGSTDYLEMYAFVSATSPSLDSGSNTYFQATLVRAI
jgi:hypothetical protein